MPNEALYNASFRSSLAISKKLCRLHTGQWLDCAYSIDVSNLVTASRCCVPAVAKSGFLAFFLPLLPNDPPCLNPFEWQPLIHYDALERLISLSFLPTCPASIPTLSLDSLAYPVPTIG